MNTYVLELVKRYRNRGLLIDANLALLYIVGSFDSSRIRRHGRTARYSEEDFLLVSKFIDQFSLRVTTPHILTEISDLLGENPELQEILKGFIGLSLEIFEESSIVSQHYHFAKAGLSETAVLNTAKDKYLVLTDDTRLFGFLTDSKIEFVTLSQM